MIYLYVYIYVLLFISFWSQGWSIYEIPRCRFYNWCLRNWCLPSDSDWFVFALAAYIISVDLMCIMFALAAYTYPHVNSISGVFYAHRDWTSARKQWKTMSVLCDRVAWFSWPWKRERERETREIDRERERERERER